MGIIKFKMATESEGVIHRNVNKNLENKRTKSVVFERIPHKTENTSPVQDECGEIQLESGTYWSQELILSSPWRLFIVSI